MPPPSLVIAGLGGYFILNFLQKSGYTTADGVYQSIVFQIDEIYKIDILWYYNVYDLLP